MTEREWSYALETFGALSMDYKEKNLKNCEAVDNTFRFEEE